MIETIQASADRVQPEKRQRRAELDADAVALLSLPSGAQVGQLPIRAVQMEQRSERLRRFDDQQKSLAADVMGRPRSSDLAREDAQREASKANSARETHAARGSTRDAPERANESFRRELADARRETPRAGAAPSPTPPPPDTGSSRDAAGAGAVARTPRTANQSSGSLAADAGATQSRTKTVHQLTAGNGGELTASPLGRLAVATAMRAAQSGQVVTAVRAAGEAQGPRAASSNHAVAHAARSERTAAKSGAAAPPREAPAAERTDDANLERVLRVIRMQLARDRSSATIRLDPAELGQLRVKLELSGSHLALDVETERDAARRLLADQLETLRRGLEASGIVLRRVDVRVVDPTPQNDPSGSANGGAAWHAGPNDQGSTRRDDGTPTGAVEHGAAGTPEREPQDPIPAAESLVNILA